MTQKTTTRSYRSALRTEQAAATRRRILAAAAACFAEGGYGGTALSAIAERAGVSLETVKANGPKRALLLGAFEQAFAGAEGREPLAESDQAAALLALPDARFLAAIVGFVAAANARTSVLWTEFLSAANADPAVDEALQGLLLRRRDDYRALVEALIERGIARPELDLETGADALSFLCSPESHQQLVLQSGWSVTRYTEWLAEAIRRQFG